MTTDSLPARRRDDLPSVARLLTLSDNVVAIALTLLVFQLKVPAAAQVADPGSATDLAAQLAKQADQLISYLIAFYVVAQFWLAHHRVFRQVAGHHEGLAWWNFAFLLTITAMPFTSSLLGQYGSQPARSGHLRGQRAAGCPGDAGDTAVRAAPGCPDRARRRRRGPGTPGAGHGHRARHRLVHRPGLGEHQRRQVLLAADPPRAVGGEPLVRPHHPRHRRGRHGWPLASPGRPALPARQKAGALAAAESPSRQGENPCRMKAAVTGRDFGSHSHGPGLAVHRWRGAPPGHHGKPTMSGTKVLRQ